MNGPTPSQDVVLSSEARVRVVRAVPGSGKTWLIAEAIRREFLEWRSAYQGIAALSFTNVAGEEIRRALGSTPSHPHFVGTIDAFLYRYVVRPFARVVNPELLVPPRLLPADAADALNERQHWYRDTSIGYRIRRGAGQLSGTLYDCHFIGLDSKREPQILFDTGPTRNRLEPAENADVLSRKKELWRRTGRMSHSDVAYVAAAILGSKRGQAARELLARRFPLLVVDELQDTGYYRSRSLLHLLKADIRGLLVGDPDQAIYGFSGARPEIFREFEALPDATCFEVRETVRCGAAICRAATTLSASGRTIQVSDLQPDRPSRALLLTYDGDLKHILQLGSELRRQVPVTDGKVALLARRNSDVNRLLGRTRGAVPRFYCRPVESLYRAVLALHEGRMGKAQAATEAALGRVLFDTDAPTVEDLAKVGLSRPDWRHGVAQMLFAGAAVESTDENAFDWGCRMLVEMEALFHRLGWWAAYKPKMPKRPRQDTQHSPRPLPQERADQVASSLSIQTVHATKGETHHTTIYLIPKAKVNQCPSNVWWSSEEGDEEELRISFVAATRPTHTFVLVLHEQSFGRLQQIRPEFLEAFAVHPLGTFLKDPHLFALAEGAAVDPGTTGAGTASLPGSP